MKRFKKKICFILLIHSSLWLYGQDYELLIFKADSVLQEKYFPRVTNKEIIDNISTDIHDYISMATYWWPNTETKSGLPYIPVDGKVNPEVNKLYNYRDLVTLKTRIFYLTEAFKVSKDVRYAKRVYEYLNFWFVKENTMMNPNFKYAQFIKGINKGRLEGIIEARHFIDILICIEDIKRSGYSEEGLFNKVVDWFSAFYDWMNEIEKEEGNIVLVNNIGTSFFYQKLVYLSFISRSSEVRKDELYWIYKRLNELLIVQFREDGAQLYELKRKSPLNYSKANIVYWNDILRFLKKNNLNTSLQEKIIEKVSIGQQYIERM